MSQSNAIYFFDRKTGETCRETVMGDQFIQWAYRSFSGKLFSPLLFRSSLLTRILGLYFDSCLSRKRIPAMISDLDIDLTEVLPIHENQPLTLETVTEQFTSFNAFFSRKLKPEVRPFDQTAETLISPADGRLLVYPEIGPETEMVIKGAKTSLKQFVGDAAEQFIGGSACVVRLCPADYHRYHFPCDGSLVSTKSFKGQYHSVNPTALECCNEVFCINKRDLSILSNPLMGQIGYLEVGAFGVSAMVNTHKGEQFSKMDEKGYFKFGGSTVVLLFQKDKIQFSADLLEQSAKGVETLVRVGETIATAKTTGAQS